MAEPGAGRPLEVVSEGVPRSGATGLKASSAEGGEAPCSSGTGNLKLLGSLQILQGVATCIFGILLGIDLSVAASTGTPWWSGATTVVAGSLTVLSHKCPSHKPLVRATFGVNVAAALVTLVALLAYGLDVAVTFVFEIAYQQWALSLCMKLAFLTSSVAAFGICVAVLVWVCRGLRVNEGGVLGQSPTDPLGTRGTGGTSCSDPQG